MFYRYIFSQATEINIYPFEMDERHDDKGDVVLLYAHPSTRKLAQQIAECCHHGREVRAASGATSIHTLLPVVANKCMVDEDFPLSDASLHVRSSSKHN